MNIMNAITGRASDRAQASLSPARAKILADVRGALEQGQAYIGRRNELSAEFDQVIAKLKADWTLPQEALMRLSVLRNAVDFTKGHEEEFRRKVAEARIAAVQRAHQATVDIRNQHREIDRLIASIIERKLPSEATGSKVDHRGSRLFADELKCRLADPDNIHFNALDSGAATIDVYVRDFNDVIGKLEVLYRELDRSEAAVAKFAEAA